MTIEEMETVEGRGKAGMCRDCCAAIGCGNPVSSLLFIGAGVVAGCFVELPP